MRYFIQLSYNGTPFHGWQRQPNAVTVQQTIEQALSTILREPTVIMGAGRTDTGVHAQMMFAHIDIGENVVAKVHLKDLIYKLNNLLPASIAIQAILPVTQEAHARFDATARSYIYKLSPVKNPFAQNKVYYYRPTVDFKKMNQAAQILLDYKDFECFSKAHTDVRTYLCNINKVMWEKVDDQWHFSITADRFLRNMVRAIVGTLLEIGRGKHEPEWMHDVLKSKDRAVAGASAPAHGLYLQKITYPETLFLN